MVVEADLVLSWPGCGPNLRWLRPSRPGTTSPVCPQTYKLTSPKMVVRAPRLRHLTENTVDRSCLIPQKISVAYNSLESRLPASSSSTAPVSRNLDPALHPFARNREYTRALAAAKLERMFAKPFVASIEGHGDGLYSLAKDDAGALARVGSGSGDGEVRVWDIGDRRSVWDVVGAHRGMVNGVCFSQPYVGEEGRVEKEVGKGERGIKRRRKDGTVKGKGKEGESDEEEEESLATRSRGSSRILSCGVDKTVKLWDIRGQSGANVKVSTNTLLQYMLHSLSTSVSSDALERYRHHVEVCDADRLPPVLRSRSRRTKARADSSKHHPLRLTVSAVAPRSPLLT